MWSAVLSGSKFCLTRRCSLLLMAAVIILLGLSLIDLAPLRQAAQNILLHTGKREPSYGLDFTLDYTPGRRVKKRTKKGPELKSPQSLGLECDRTVQLQRIDQVSSVEDGLFMMETSGRGTLNSRQACGVESAAMRSGLSVHLLLFSSELNLRDNTTCQLYMSGNNIKFYTVDVVDFARNTPLEGFFDDPRLLSSAYRPGHTADALRLLMVYKYGGFYLDLDYVVFNDLTHYHNIVVGNRPDSGITGNIISLTNNAFKFSKQHPLLSMAMKKVKQTYNPNCWICIGPQLLTDTARQLAGTKLVSRIPASADLHFVPMKTIMSVHFPQVNTLLFPERPFGFQVWQKLFAQSSAVHFFSKTTSLLTSYDDPRYSAYALLGPRYCPRSYYSTKKF